MIELPGDDYAGNTSTIMSPLMFRKFIKPYIERMIKIMLHSDCAITSRLQDITNLGADVIHPLEPLPATDFTAAKERFGKQITFLCGIDISHAMTGSREDVIAETKHRIVKLVPAADISLPHPATCKRICLLKM